MNNVYDNGIWINIDKLASVIYDGTILDVGSTSLSRADAQRLAEHIIYSYRHYGDMAIKFPKVEDTPGDIHFVAIEERVY